MRQWAAAQAAKGKKAYAYFFSHVQNVNGQPSPQGATHTAEISFAWNNPKGQATQTWNDVDMKLADQMSSYWVNFITKGDPNGARPAAVAGIQGPDERQGDGVRRHAAGRAGAAGAEAGLLCGGLPASAEGRDELAGWRRSPTSAANGR